MADLAGIAGARFRGNVMVGLSTSAGAISLRAEYQAVMPAAQGDEIGELGRAAGPVFEVAGVEIPTRRAAGKATCGIAGISCLLHRYLSFRLLAGALRASTECNYACTTAP
jgi:hypothetical protein